MRRALVLFVFLAGAVQSAAQIPKERSSLVLRAIQEESLVGLESVHLRTLAWTDQVSPEILHAIVRSAIASDNLRILSVSEGVAAEPPFLRLTYDINDRTLEGGQTVAVYRVSLELVQAVSWTWDTDTDYGNGSDGGLAVTWSASHADVASDAETASLEIQKQVTGLGRLFAADVRQLNPVWEGWGMGLDADGHMKCEPFTSRPRRSPKPAGGSPAGIGVAAESGGRKGA